MDYILLQVVNSKSNFYWTCAMIMSRDSDPNDERQTPGEDEAGTGEDDYDDEDVNGVVYSDADDYHLEVVSQDLGISLSNIRDNVPNYVDVGDWIFFMFHLNPMLQINFKLECFSSLYFEEYFLS